MTWPTERIRQQFPILSRTVHGRPLVYLDNAATTQKPTAVIQAITEYYQQHNANVHRGVHTLGDESTRLFHDSRQTIADFFGAREDELVLTRNTTEGINLLATSWGESQVRAGDTVVATLMEHHSNFVPWQRVAKRKEATFVAAPLLPDGRLDEAALRQIIDEAGDTLKVLALTHLSNATGAVTPVESILSYLGQKTWRSQVLAVVDAAQSAARIPINFDRLGADALVFSGHKLYGPMGIGGLLVKQKRLAELEPMIVGGGMIGRVSVEETTYAEDLRDRFTAGTPDVASAAGLAAACRFLQELGMTEVQRHDQEITAYAYTRLIDLSGIEVVGPRPENGRQGSVAFLYKGIHAHDVAQVLDHEGVAVRSGHHCTMPLHTHFHWTATTRASFAVYTTKEEIDQLLAALRKVTAVFESRHG